MEQDCFTSTEIRRIFRLDDKLIARQTLFNAESRDEIPRSTRMARGKTQVRQWSIDQLPDIGKRFGFLAKPASQKVVCIFTQKGGTLKSTLTYTFARATAINGIKTIVVGLDIQASITNLLLPVTVESLTELSAVRNRPGLFHVFYEGAVLADVIQKTDLPTLDVIPETASLAMLGKMIPANGSKQNPYTLFKDKLLPLLAEYDLVIFDNAPNWSPLVENALTAAQSVIAPVACDVGTYQVLDNNLAALNEFQTAFKIEWDNFIMVPTLLEKSKLSQQIYAAYVANHSEAVLPVPIRRAVIGQESSALNRSVLEYDPASDLAQDYFELMKALWKKVAG